MCAVLISTAITIGLASIVLSMVRDEFLYTISTDRISLVIAVLVLLAFCVAVVFSFCL